MNIHNIAMDLKNSVLCYPFDKNTRVYKVENKMFMLTNNDYEYVSLKNTPDKNYILRASCEYITAGYHLNKEHWITIDLSDEYDSDLVNQLIVESYELVLNKLPQKVRDAYL